MHGDPQLASSMDGRTDGFYCISVRVALVALASLETEMLGFALGVIRMDRIRNESIRGTAEDWRGCSCQSGDGGDL